MFYRVKKGGCGGHCSGVGDDGRGGVGDVGRGGVGDDGRGGVGDGGRGGGCGDGW